MSLKAKLFSSIAAFALVACLLIVGVFALSPANVGMNGTITFTSSDVIATLTAKLDDGHSSQHEFSEIKIDENTDAVNDAAWDNIGLAFTSHSDVISLDITVTNDSTERAIDVTFTAPSGVDNVTVTSQYDDAASFTEGQEISGPVRIETEQSATFRVTFDITNDAESVDGTWSIGLNLANVAEW